MNAIKRYTAALLLLIAAAISQNNAQKLPSGTGILENIEKVFEPVKDFTVTIDGSVAMEKVNIPNIHATMYFKKPKKIHFESRSFMMMPREVVNFMPEGLRDKYDVQQVANDTLNGSNVLKLELRVKNIKESEKNLTMWVDRSQWTVSQIEMTPYDGRIVTVKFTYALQQNQFWLPSAIDVNFATSAEKQPQETPLQTPAQQGMPDFQIGMPRSGRMTMHYSNYKINTGLDDSIFENKK